MYKKRFNIYIISLLILVSVLTNFNNYVTASNSLFTASVKIDNVNIDCEGNTTYAYLHAEGIVEHVGSCTISIYFNPNEVSIVSADNSEFDSLFSTIINNTLYLLGIMGSDSYLTGDFNIAKIGFTRVGNVGCSLEIINSELLTDNPKPNPINHTKINGYATVDCNTKPNAPSNPSPVNGAIDIDVNSILYWSCSDPDGDDLTYDIYFEANDSSPDILASNDQEDTLFNPGNLKSETTYYWQIIAKDIHGTSTSGPIWYFTTIKVVNNPPNKPNKPSGETNGKNSKDYLYTTSTTDPEGDQVYYMWDWGDQSFSTWLGPYDSGFTEGASHSWAKGSYNIKVKAKDTYGLESEWSEPLAINMQKNKALEHTILGLFFEKLIQRFPFFEKILNP